mgnify:CR=1 FL=1
MILLVLLEVLGQVRDALGEQRDLNLRGAGVALMGSVLSDDVLLFFSRQCHGILLIALRGAAGIVPERSLSAGENTPKRQCTHSLRPSTMWPFCSPSGEPPMRPAWTQQKRPYNVRNHPTEPSRRNTMGTVTKIGIVGMGHVGAHVANSLVLQGIGDELYMTEQCSGDEDHSAKLAAEVQDLGDSLAFCPHNVALVNCGDDYARLAECDVIVNAAGKVSLASKDRDGELFYTTETAKTFIKPIADAGFDGVWITISNPCDVVATEIWKLSGMDPNRIIGTGTALDSSRLKYALSRATGYDQHSICAYMLGEHGSSMFAAWGAVNFGGGYAMIAVVKETVVDKFGWLTEDEFMEVIAIAESTPGPIAINMATYVGYKRRGVLGSAAATLGVVLPSFIIILLVATLLTKLLKYAGVKAVLGGIKPAIVGMILATALTMFLSVILNIATHFYCTTNYFFIFFCNFVSNNKK